MRNPSTIMAAEQGTIAAEQQKIGIAIDKEISETFNGFQKQHIEFERHCKLQIATLEATQKLRERGLLKIAF